MGAMKSDEKQIANLVTEIISDNAGEYFVTRDEHPRYLSVLDDATLPAGMLGGPAVMRVEVVTSGAATELYEVTVLVRRVK